MATAKAPKRTGVRSVRKKKTRHARRSELTRYGRVKWVPVQSVEPPHSVRYPHHLERIVRSMRRARSPSKGGCMWTGRPLLVERVRPGWRHPGIRYVAWTGSHRIAAAFAAGQWLVPVIEINKRFWDSEHGKPETSRLSETYDDESRLARLLVTKDERAIRLMEREIPREDQEKRARAARHRRRWRRRRAEEALWRSLGPNLEAHVMDGEMIQVRHKGMDDSTLLHKTVLERLLEELTLATAPAVAGMRAANGGT